MTFPTRRRRPPGSGFSLLEVVVASALLLLTVASVTAAVTAVSRAGSRAETVGRADQALRSTYARLAALPFCAVALPEPPGGVPGTSDLVAEVFPRADVSRNVADARYVPADGDGLSAGSFVTLSSDAGAPVRCVARFRTGAGAWLGPSELDGWDVAASAGLPAAVLSVDISCSLAGVTRSARLVRVAGADPAPAPSPAVTAAP